MDDSKLNIEPIAFLKKAFADQKFADKYFKKFHPQVFIQNEIASLLKGVALDFANVLSEYENKKVSKAVIGNESNYLTVRFENGSIKRIDLLSIYVPGKIKWMGLKVKSSWYCFSEGLIKIALDYLIDKNDKKEIQELIIKT